MWAHLIPLGIIRGAGGEPVSEIAGGHYGAWWLKKWQEQFEKPPTVEEVEEFVEEAPAQAIEALKTVAPEIAVGVTKEMLQNNESLLKSIAAQLLIAIELKRIAQDEEDDMEAILLML